MGVPSTGYCSLRYINKMRIILLFCSFGRGESTFFCNIQEISNIERHFPHLITIKLLNGTGKLLVVIIILLIRCGVPNKRQLFILGKLCGKPFSGSSFGAYAHKMGIKAAVIPAPSFQSISIGWPLWAPRSWRTTEKRKEGDESKRKEGAYKSDL